MVREFFSSKAIPGLTLTHGKAEKRSKKKPYTNSIQAKFELRQQTLPNNFN